MSNEIEEQWMNMGETAKLLNISYNKLSRLVRQKAIRTQEDILDQRAKLVNVEEVKRIFKRK